MKPFKFFTDNKINIEDDSLYHLDVYENMALGLISYCMRASRSPIEWKHHFREGVNKCLEIKEILFHNNFESPHVKIVYSIHTINNPGNADMTNTREHTFHLAEDVYNEVIRNNETI
jgi:hypothetical protein